MLESWSETSGESSGGGTHSGVNLGVVFGELENFTRVLRPMWTARELGDERFGKVVICMSR